MQQQPQQLKCTSLFINSKSSSFFLCSFLHLLSFSIIAVLAESLNRVKKGLQIQKFIRYEYPFLWLVNSILSTTNVWLIALHLYSQFPLWWKFTISCYLIPKHSQFIEHFSFGLVFNSLLVFSFGSNRKWISMKISSFKFCTLRVRLFLFSVSIQCVQCSGSHHMWWNVLVGIFIKWHNHIPWSFTFLLFVIAPFVIGCLVVGCR